LGRKERVVQKHEKKKPVHKMKSVREINFVALASKIARGMVDQDDEPAIKHHLLRSRNIPCPCGSKRLFKRCCRKTIASGGHMLLERQLEAARRMLGQRAGKSKTETTLPGAAGGGKRAAQTAVWLEELNETAKALGVPDLPEKREAVPHAS
jgi:hypothetical protein